ncbi:polysaccharide biosynthesis tyrosine autokinase [Mycobacterium kyorinense]|uniref:Chain-length determining protein n=1 Tax=Mycobacterium kyorinense TaxID=487514 RepID=A0A1X1XW06_9MYCO|nr:polysaccharide biosynthesis tyrosine autokinase [Mycobacterium kyorinense]ORW02954.1 chain-length determining protein [Mycobacterium kyorinense]
MDFRTFARTIARHWQLVVGAVLACLVGAAAVTAFQTKSYQSSATILISFSGETNLADVYQATQAAQERLSSYAQIAGGHAVAQRAVNDFHAPANADALVSQTHVSYTPKTTLFTVTVEDTDPVRVAALAAAMADAFAAMVPTLGAAPLPPPPPGPPKPVALPSHLDGDGASESTGLAAAGDTGTSQPSPLPPAPLQPPVPVARATVIERPGVPAAPIKPVPMRNMAMGLLAGVLLGIAVALTRQAADRTVRDREQLEQLSGAPTLAELPGRRDGTPRFGAEGSFDDAIRGLRTRLLRAMGPDARRVLVAAPFGGEGTTTTALNLAMAITELGETVLVVEGDVRRPVIAGLLGVKSGLSLANVLVDRDVAAEAVRATPVEDLFVLASRTARGDETLPRSAILPDVLADLSARFDRIVVDGPPVLATADTGLLADAVEATVLVVRAGRTTVDEVKDALHALRNTGTAVVGTVLTDARVSRHTRAAVQAYWRRPYRARLRGAA